LKILLIKYSVKPIVMSLLTITMLFYGTVLAQDQIRSDDGIIITKKGDVTVSYDEFTGEYIIGVTDTTLFSSLDKNFGEERRSYLIPFFGGGLYDNNLAEFTGTARWSDGFNIILMREEPENNFFEKQGSKQIPFLIDGKRVSKTANYLKGPSIEITQIAFNSSEWENIIKSENSRYRISGQVFTIDQNSKNLMEQILSEHQRIQSEKDNDIEEQKTTLSSPYDLRWEGDFDRSPMVQPLPENVSDVEAVITVRFEVFPDGSIGRIIPLRQMNTELGREVMQTLRSWRFSSLPSGVPQEPQWGTITFRFVYD